MKQSIKIGLVVAAIVIALVIGSKAQVDPAYGGAGWVQGAPLIIVMDPQVGDVNRDGNITNADVVALHIMRRFAHIGDVNGDNKVDEQDEDYLIEYILGEGEAPKPRTRCRSVRVATPCWYEGAPKE